MEILAKVTSNTNSGGTNKRVQKSITAGRASQIAIIRAAHTLERRRDTKTPLQNIVKWAVLLIGSTNKYVVAFIILT